MTGTWETWVTLIALIGSLLLSAYVAVDRNRLKRRLDAAEGELTGLRLDLAAARDHAAEADPAGPVPDRWSPGPGQGVDAESVQRSRPTHPSP